MSNSADEQKPFIKIAGPIRSRNGNEIAARDREIERELTSQITCDLTTRVIVHGPYQSGKSTLLRFLNSRIRENRKKLPIIVDLGPVLDSKMFWHEIGSALDLPKDQRQETDVIDTIRQRSENENGPALVMLFDELQRIYGNEELCRTATFLFQRMANLTNLSYVAVGTFELHQLHYNEERVAALTKIKDSPFNKAVFRSMPQLSAKEMEDLLSQYNKAWDEVPVDVAAEIISESKGHAASFMILLQLFKDFAGVVENAKDWKRIFAGNLYRYLNGLGTRLKVIIRKNVDMQYRLQQVLKFGPDAQWKTDLQNHSNPDVKMLNDGILDLAVDHKGEYQCRFTSTIIFRYCTDIITERKRKPLPREMVTNLATLLRFAIAELSPEQLASKHTQNLHGPSEASFHFEIYSALNAILPEGMQCFSEANARNRDQVDLLIMDGEGKDYWGCITLKVGKHSENDMKEPYNQAKKYADFYRIPAIIVNFILEGQRAPTLQDMKNVLLLNVLHSPDCKTFKCSLLEEGQPKTYDVSASG